MVCSPEKNHAFPQQKESIFLFLMEAIINDVMLAGELQRTLRFLN